MRTAKHAAPTSLRVRATRRTYYSDRLRRENDVFDLSSADDFAPGCMVLVDMATPVKTSTPQDAVDIEAPTTARNRIRNRLMPATEADGGRALSEFDPFDSSEDNQ